MFVHKSSIIDEDVEIGESTKIWAFSHLCKGAKIGKNCVIGEGVYIGPGVVIGDFCKIQNSSNIFEGVTIEDEVIIGPSVVTTNDFRPKAVGDWKDRFKKTLIKKGSSIGANSTIICGVTIGENVLVGAGSVVTKDIPSNYLSFGNPARLKNKII